MKCKIIHESRGRLRVHLECARMSLDEADVLEYYMRSVDGVDEVKVYDRTRDAVICYCAERAAVINALAAFSFPAAEAMQLVPEHTTRELNREFEDKLAMAVLRRTASKLFLPVPVTTAIAIVRSLKYIHEGLKALLHGRLSVAVLDATAVSVSMLRGDFSTASSVMFMLSLGEILEEWTHKKSVADLAGAMSINIDKAWLRTGETETLVPVGDIRPGDEIVIRTGCMIPLDGKVIEGEAMVNQASMTGESMPAAKRPGSYVYAGTVAEVGIVFLDRRLRLLAELIRQVDLVDTVGRGNVGVVHLAVFARVHARGVILYIVVRVVHRDENGRNIAAFKHLALYPAGRQAQLVLHRGQLVLDYRAERIVKILVYPLRVLASAGKRGDLI